jgi:hypothetical protein
MTSGASRVLFAFTSFLQVLGGIAHSFAFPKASAALLRVQLPPFFSNSFKALWLADSTTMFVLAAVLATIAIRPSTVTKPVVLLLGMIPLFVAALIYFFLGGFFAAHLLLATAVLIFIGGGQLPRSV